MESMRRQLAEIAATPDDRALTLPGSFYTDPAWFELEVAEVLEPGWQCVGAAGEIPEPGDYFTVDHLGEPLVVVRSASEEVRVLANVCRHRGMRVVDDAGTTSAFTCPYHAWSYRLDGGLATTAYVDEPWFDTEACRLHEWRSEIWNGFVFVDLSGEATPLAESLQHLGSHMENFEPTSFVWAHTEDEVWNTNWKCVVENFIEGYHLSVVHPLSLHHLTPTRLARMGPTDDAFTSFWSYFPDDLPSRGPGANGITDENRTRSLLYVMFPTQLVSQNASFLASLNVFPEAVDRTRIRWTVSANRKCDQDLIDGAVNMWRTVNAEDHAVLSRLQRALGSRVGRGYAGPLVDEDKEGTIHQFHRHLAARMGVG